MEDTLESVFLEVNDGMIGTYDAMVTRLVSLLHLETGISNEYSSSAILDMLSRLRVFHHRVSESGGLAPYWSSAGFGNLVNAPAEEQILGIVDSVCGICFDEKDARARDCLLDVLEKIFQVEEMAGIENWLLKEDLYRGNEFILRVYDILQYLIDRSRQNQSLPSEGPRTIQIAVL